MPKNFNVDLDEKKLGATFFRRMKSLLNTFLKLKKNQIKFETTKKLDSFKKFSAATQNYVFLSSLRSKTLIYNLVFWFYPFG